MEFGIPGYDDLVWDVSLVCDRIGDSTQHGLNDNLQLGDYLNARARSKIGKFRRDYAVKNIAFAPAILSVDARFILDAYVSCGCWLRLLWVLADMQTVKYFNLVGDEEDIRNERLKWSQASTFRYNRNAIGLALYMLQHSFVCTVMMTLLTPWVPLLFTLDQHLIVSSAALLTSLILASRETLLQVRLLPVVLSAGHYQ